MAATGRDVVAVQVRDLRASACFYRTHTKTTGSTRACWRGCRTVYDPLRTCTRTLGRSRDEISERASHTDHRLTAEFGRAASS